MKLCRLRSFARYIFVLCIANTAIAMTSHVNTTTPAAATSRLAASTTTIPEATATPTHAVLTTTPDEITTTSPGNICGVPAITPWTVGWEIVGGIVARPHSWPWQCGIRYKESLDKPFCGCSVLTKHWVVSAAHCAPGIAIGDIEVVVGAHNATAEETTQQIARPSQFIVHPQYAPETNDFDIWLIKLATPLQFNDYVSPICLPTADFPDDHRCVATGWGTIREDGDQPDVLMQVVLPIINNSTCNAWYGNITDTMLCAGYAAGGKDTCYGDGGGPLVCQTNSGAWQLAGITSWGEGCAEAEFPGVYTRVTRFVSWINSTITG